MSQEGDGMGDVIRKAAAPAGEGSYKKVRDKTEPFVCQPSPSRQGGNRSKRCPPPSQGTGSGCCSGEAPGSVQCTGAGQQTSLPLCFHVTL